MKIYTAAYISIIIHFVRKMLSRLFPESNAQYRDRRYIKAAVPNRDTCYGTLTSGWTTMFVMHVMSDLFKPREPTPFTREYSTCTGVFGTAWELAAYAREHCLTVAPATGHRSAHIDGDEKAVRHLHAFLAMVDDDQAFYSSCDEATRLVWQCVEEQNMSEPDEEAR